MRTLRGGAAAATAAGAETGSNGGNEVHGDKFCFGEKGGESGDAGDDYSCVNFYDSVVEAGFRLGLVGREK